MIGILGLVLLLTVTPVELAVTPQTGMAPLAVRLTMTVEPNALNRKLCVDWDSERVSGSHCESMDGADFPRTTHKALALSAGSYTFHATIYRVDNTTVFSKLVTVDVV